MPAEEKKYPNPREEDIYAGDRRVSRPDSALPDWHIPDAKYRPIPIAWFAAAFLIQMVVLAIVSLHSVDAWLYRDRAAGCGDYARSTAFPGAAVIRPAGGEHSDQDRGTKVIQRSAPDPQ